MSKLFRFLFPAVKLAAGAAAALPPLGLAVTSAAGQTTPADATYSKSVQPFFAKNCYACHNSGLSSGGLNLQAFSSAALFFQDRDEAEKVLKKLQAGEMPPKALPGPDADKYGAFHTSKVPYVFNSLTKSDRPFTDADHKIAEIMSSYWANFATTGDPNGKGLPHWPSVSEKPGRTMELGDTNAPIRIAGDKAKEEFFTEFFSKQLRAQRP